MPCHIGAFHRRNRAPMPEIKPPVQDIPMDKPARMPPCYGLLAARDLTARTLLTAPEIEAIFSTGVPEKPIWLHLDLLDTRVTEFIRALPGLPEQACALLCDRNESSHLDTENDAIWGTIPDFAHEVSEEPDPAYMGVLHLVMTPTMLITARRHPLRAPSVIGYGQASLDTTAAQWDHLMRAIMEGISRAAKVLALKLDNMEDRLLQGYEVTRDELAGLRRSVLLLYRRVEPTVELYGEIAEIAPEWIGEAGHDMSRVTSRLESLKRNVMSLQERGRIAQDQLAARNAEETNHSLMILSVLTAILLPPTLVTGIFGMNTTGLPGTSGPGGTYIAFMAILGSVAGACLLLNRLGLLRFRSEKKRR
ncbi:Divalent cation transporter [Granulibacter bethesdensis CGDNIH4]|nr:Divalent cation transporter [Granulibacter bethesdensis CGDNIH4]